MTQTHNITLDDLIQRRRPGWSLEQPFYTDEAIFAVDVERIFGRSWLFAGHESRIPRPHDYFTMKVGKESIIVIRSKNGEINALVNICRHRGSRICLDECGRATSLVCPYHQWVYSTDGSLLSAKEMPEDFDKSPFGLHRIGVRSCEGLIFINFSDAPPDFSTAHAHFSSLLASNGVADAKVCHRLVYEVHANWKLIVENFGECYHCDGSHPEYCSAIVGAGAPRSKAHLEERLKAASDHQATLKQLGLAEGTSYTRQTGFGCGRYPLKQGHESWSVDGKPVAPMMSKFNSRDAGMVAVVCHPSLWLEGCCDYFTTTRLLPVAPTLSGVEVTWHVHKDAVEGVDYDVERVIALWKATAEQDFRLCENNQAGVNSHWYKAGPHSNTMEGQGLEDIHGWYVDQIGRPA